MKQKFLIQSTLVGIFSLTTQNVMAATLTGSTTWSGTSSSSVVKGTVIKDGKPVMTTPEQLESNKKQAMRYDGNTEFESNYTIVWDDTNNMLDTSKSTVTLKTIKYTLDGKLVDSNFTTKPITITKVTFMNNDHTMLESFMFNSTEWYGDSKVKDNGLSGTINLKTGNSSYDASYINKDDGATYTYTVTANIKPPSPVPDPPVGILGNPEIYTPLTVPEPSSALSFLALGTLGVGSSLLRNKKQKKSSEKEIEKVS